MSISFVGASGRYTYGTTVTTGTAVAVEVGDILLAYFTDSNGTGSVRVIPPAELGASSTCTATTFVEVFSEYKQYSVEHSCYRAVVTGAGDAYASFDLVSARGATVALVVFRGVDTSSPIRGAVQATIELNTTAPNASAVTPVAGDVVVSGFSPLGGVANNLITPTSGWSVAVELDNDGYIWNTPMLVEYVAATDATPLAGAPALSSARDCIPYNFVLKQYVAEVPGTTVARGLYL